ncbi:MAG: PDZ domain-containing protein [Actinobacteria bacterium]|nr:MAG: PDZ domain-containing protein [Actinomycetota bacterium]
MTGSRSGRRLTPLIATAAAGFLLFLGACTNGHASATRTSGRPAAGPTPSLPAANPLVGPDLQGDPIVSVVRRVAPAVVNVTSSTLSEGAFGQVQPGKGVGTGFVIRSDGIIVTNFHVVEGALKLKVTLPPPDGRSFDARVINGDSDHDVAVLKVAAGGLPTVPLGDSSKVALGERVIALGYALALPGGPTVTSGIISSLARTVQVQDPSEGLTRTLEDALQTDAAINPGNSGGPLVDLAGNVVGINTAGNTGAENIGFAIAIDAAKPIIQQGIAHPNSPAAYLGVSTQTVDAGFAAQFGLPVDHGAYVVGLAPGGPAEKAGIQTGDVIVSLGGTAIETDDQLREAILRHKPGDQVTVTVVRSNGTRSTVTVTLDVRPVGP